MRETAKPGSTELRIAAYVIAIGLCVFLGPFGTSEDLGLWDRLVFWTLAVGSVGAVMEYWVVGALNSHWLRRLNPYAKLAVGATFGAVPGAAVVVFINRVFRPEHLEHADFPIMWAKVTVMALLFVGLDFLISPKERVRGLLYGPSATPDNTDDGDGDGDAPAASAPEICIPPLLQRLPPHMREGQIISMSMQDHYVVVTGTKGTEMILMRLSDAIELLDTIPGVQTHRSHWAAERHAVKLVKEGRRHALELSDGRSLPVSNSFVKSVSHMLNAKGQT